VRRGQGGDAEVQVEAELARQDLIGRAQASLLAPQRCYFDSRLIAAEVTSRTTFLISLQLSRW
jgi:hypothetical protein